MLKQYNRILLQFPPELPFYFSLNLCKFFFFGLNGWFYITLFASSTILFNTTKLLIRFFFSSSSTLKNLTLGLIKIYSKFIQLRGRGFRVLFHNFSLAIKLGYSHKLYYNIPNNSRFSFINRQILKISTRYLNVLHFFFFDFNLIRKFDVYKGKGIAFYKDSLVLKVSTKKSKV